MSSPASPRGVGSPSAAARSKLNHPGVRRLKGRRGGASPRSPRSTPRSITDKFRVMRVLGRGSYSVVRLAQDRATGEKVALKVVKRPRAARAGGGESDEQIVQLAREVKLTLLAQHPSVVRLHDVVETPRRVYIVMEYVRGGDLFSYVSERGALPAAEALGIFRQVVDAVDHCHHRDICHRDLKPENILLARGTPGGDDGTPQVRVADFGLARLTSEDAQCETRCGSPHYMSPEQFSLDGYDGKMADVWALGAVLYVMTTASMPFAQAPGEETLPSLVRAIQAGRFYTPRFLNRDVADLIARCLTVDVRRRITLAEVLEHPAWRILDHRAAAAPAPAAATATAIPSSPEGSPRRRRDRPRSPVPRRPASPEGAAAARERSQRIRRDSLTVLQTAGSADGCCVVVRPPAGAEEGGAGAGDSPSTSGSLAPAGEEGDEDSDEGELDFSSF